MSYNYPQFQQNQRYAAPQQTYSANNQQQYPNYPIGNSYPQNQRYPANSQMQQYPNYPLQNYSRGEYRSDNIALKLSEEEEYQPRALTLEGSARNGFIVKVYSLVSIQILVTFLVGLWAINSQTFKNIFVNPAMAIILSVTLMGLSIVIGCCTDYFRKYSLPIFVTFTLVFSLLIGITISNYSSKVVLTAAGITLALVIALTIYAWHTKSDMTEFGPYLLVFLIAMFAFGILLIFWQNPILQLVYSCLAVILFGIYLIFDTQMILGNKKYSYSLDDAYLASIQLYIDIMQLFLNLLRILGQFQR